MGERAESANRKTRRANQTRGSPFRPQPLKDISGNWIKKEKPNGSQFCIKKKNKSESIQHGPPFWFGSIEIGNGKFRHQQRPRNSVKIRETRYSLVDDDSVAGFQWNLVSKNENRQRFEDRVVETEKKVAILLISFFWQIWDAVKLGKDPRNSVLSYPWRQPCRSSIKSRFKKMKTGSTARRES